VPTDPTAAVPSCPGWTVADLTRHVGEVYLHTTLAMREGAEPDPWPPKELADEEPLALLDGAYAGLLDEFAAHKPEDPAGSWYTPDQNVGFWIRRMSQETVIHRIDAELGTGQPVAPVPADLAGDGSDELLKVFVAYSVATWGDYFTDMLAGSPGRTYAVRPRARGVAGADRPGAIRRPGRCRRRRGRRDRERPAGGRAALAVEPGGRWRAERHYGRGRPGGGRGAAALHRHGDAVRPVSRPSLPAEDGLDEGPIRGRLR
jgi:uncharacterized protein (TIGR03083 family)